MASRARPGGQHGAATPRVRPQAEQPGHVHDRDGQAHGEDGHVGRPVRDNQVHDGGGPPAG